jgi:malonyl-CoA O-methyltransferase
MSAIQKNVIERNFSRHAGTYDEFAHVQRLAASELAKGLPSDGVSRILEIGCGTGIYTELLSERFPGARIVALDISEKMIEVAQGKISGTRVEFARRDGEGILPDGEFDLITSNSTLQWFTDLEGALISYKGMLADGGRLIFSIFGPRTFEELGRVVREVRQESAGIASEGFLPGDAVRSMMEHHFKDVRCRESVIEESFPSLKGLLRQIKYTGTRGTGTGAALVMGPATLREIEEEYMRIYGRIRATYQIFFCEASR